MIYGYPNGNSLDDLEKVVTDVVAHLRPRKKLYDSIVVRGMSGVLVGVPVSMKLKKPLVIVRKPGERSHAKSEGAPIININNIGERWLFLDDLIDSGGTLLACKRALKSTGAVMVAGFLYQSGMTYVEES